ncbi:SPOR domain-containing protein [Sphingomonas sp. HF-S4]|uniref:SPOR domain-containing protein n=1 Tax=Sphingomonas agrestis TaxID=3080540 RepID=A0ABU3Y4C1_9SPHN|nr:SPOR domain-containing protein [Sphingomonas sp. HF-S4]MDV3456246.1 SPOR domain-containing protein [Sphingomonas sp. HF-S4]
MNDTDSLFPIALIQRPRRRTWLFATLASLPLLALVPVLGMAKASRQAPSPAVAATRTRAAEHQIDRPATITLGAMIEVQRREREARRALAEVQQSGAALPPGEAWQAQLGAFGSAEAAERQRARLVEAGVIVVVRQEGALHRLHSVPALRAEIEGLCARAMANGVDCFLRRAI